LIETLVTLPETLQLSTDDWPRTMELGSAPNWVTDGAGGGGGGAGVTTGGGGGGGAGAFFLHPPAKIASDSAKPMKVICRLLNMNSPPDFISSTFPTRGCN
jgi:hypothetical protein